MNVLIIPEDFRKDQYILEPLFRSLFADIGRPQARVAVCRDPLMGGLEEALKEERLREVVSRYGGMTQVFLLCVDRDADRHRKARLQRLEEVFRAECAFIAEHAWEELETWLLAGLELPVDWSWRNVRKARDVKEEFYEPLAKSRGVADGPGGGRRALGRESARRIDAIRQRCPEDFDELARQLSERFGR